MDEKTRQDLAADYAELKYLALDLNQKLDRLNQLVSKHKKNITSKTSELVKTVISDLRIQVTALIASLQASPTITFKNEAYETIRTLYGIFGGLATSLNWQSPSFGTSLFSQAGLQTGKIIGNINDYTRDQHLDGNEAQNRFSREYLGRHLGLPITVHFTTSGMAALTTIILFLKRIKKVTGPVLIGQESYFQIKELILNLFDQVVEFDETDLSDLSQNIKNHKPELILIDSMSNSPRLSQPDMKQVIRSIIKYTSRETYLLIDNTMLGLGLNIPQLLPITLGKVKILVWESLNKYYQFGLDRSTGGMFWGWPNLNSSMFYTRMHAGTNITPQAVWMMPTPNRKMLKKRLERFKRNRDYLAKVLGDKNVPLKKPNQFAGCSLVIKQKDKRWIKRLIRQAKKEKVPLVAGTSFGLNITRIYAVGVNSVYTKPFVRVSVGTETWQEIKRLASLIVKDC